MVGSKAVLPLVALALLAGTAGSPAEEFSGNPVFPGWYADPEGIMIDDEYWIFPTFSAPYDEQLHFDAFSSKDLVSWTKHERIIDKGGVSWLRRALWAPAIIEKDDKFYLFFGANDVKPGETGGIGVAVADQPQGPYKDLLGKPLISGHHNGAQPIDQFVFKDQGTYYMVYGGWSHCNIAKLNDDFTGFVPFDDGTTFKEITPEGYVEGPVMFRRDGKLYFMWSEGGWTGPDYSVAYAIADSPLGPFQRVAKVLEQDPEVATGAGHHSVIHDKAADIWYAVYHRRPLGETDANHRVTCIDRMEFAEDGTIKPIAITRGGVPAKKLAGQ
jgi:beta-xylosidase